MAVMIPLAAGMGFGVQPECPGQIPLPFTCLPLSMADFSLKIWGILGTVLQLFCPNSGKNEKLKYCFQDQGAG